MKLTLLVTLATLLSASARPTSRATADDCAVCTIKTPYPAVDSYLNGNCRWAAATNKRDPTFLPTLATAQHPPLLWIGCADSRVPETVITKKRPGDIFVHRNIANQFHPEDDSANAVLNYGVLHVGVSDVVVVGHTSCGGAKAAYEAVHPPAAAPAGHRRDEAAAAANDGSDHLNRFLAPLIDIAKGLPGNSTIDDLIVANVKKGVENVVASITIKAAWAQGKNVTVHGWVYHLDTGLITDLGVSRGRV
ncbi:Carbonic anhydrase 2 [Vanrija pseudolonga]|uniref:Carbonic anhydrase n=1 Tax=Vanrija pseudolonga TaxID=143232 RepID=A0AAF0Y1Z5_9TREE|nr:Carbonic anhydrase 2 [Vanrija pseudolonga]